MSVRRWFLMFVLALCLPWGVAQTGGKYIYNFLSFSNSSRVAGLGGGLVAVYDDDPSLLLNNPSLIGARHSTSLMVNAVDYFSKASYGSA